MIDRPPRDLHLLTLGPLTMPVEIRAEMPADRSSNAKPHIAPTQSIRDDVLDFCDGHDTHVCVPLQGSSTHGIKAALDTGPADDFPTFYGAMERRGFVISRGRLTAADTFRVGVVRNLDTDNMTRVLAAIDDIGESLAEIGVRTEAT